MNKIKVISTGLIMFLSLAGLHAQSGNRVSVSQEIQVLDNGSKSIFKCDIYYNKEKDAVVTHHTYPAEFIKMSNRFGEMKIYFPETNSVTVQQGQSFATTNELLYYFVNNKLTDMGLVSEGFKLISTTREEDMIVTIWQSPLSLKAITQIKVVYKNMLPIYAEYIAKNGLITRKIYYSQYSDFKAFRLPLRITEISFVSKTDSTIRLSVFSNVRTTDLQDDKYFNFKIPDDAKITE